MEEQQLSYADSCRVANTKDNTSTAVTPLPKARPPSVKIGIGADGGPVNSRMPLRRRGSDSFSSASSISSTMDTITLNQENVDNINEKPKVVPSPIPTNTFMNGSASKNISSELSTNTNVAVPSANSVNANPVNKPPIYPTLKAQKPPPAIQPGPTEDFEQVSYTDNNQRSTVMQNNTGKNIHRSNSLPLCSVDDVPPPQPHPTRQIITVPSPKVSPIPQYTEKLMAPLSILPLPPTFVKNVSSSSAPVISESYIPSPTSNQHEIVERSPGGRYVRFAEKLGSGAYKNVYRSYDTSEGIEVAWNVVHLSKLAKADRARIVNEVRLLERLHHRNIISFYGSWVNRELEQVIFVTEILSSGTLKQFINKVQVIRLRIAKRWALQILQGLEYLHLQDPPIIHRDLKCDNIFINGTSGDLRIGDFGLSTMINNSNDKALSVLGTPEFMAPELYDESYDEKVDIYAFAMCLLEIFTKEVPYSECANPAQIYKKVTNGIPPASISRIRNEYVRDFTTYCMGTISEQGLRTRPSASELMRHPFFEESSHDEFEVEVDPPPCNDSISGLPIITEREVGDSCVSELTHKGPSENDLTACIIRPLAGFTARVPSMESVVLAVTTDEQNIMSNPSQQENKNSNELEFDGMPESETHMKKVKVLMGRGHLIQGSDEPPTPMQTPTVSSNAKLEADNLNVRPAISNGVQGGTTNLDTRMVKAEPKLADTGDGVVQNVIQDTLSSANVNNVAVHPGSFIMAASVIEDPTENSYDDDIMKLIVTLPIEGKRQNVQFDFHLVEDDPVKVAREMVTELHIPESAVLEISETLSGLARAARIKQSGYNQQNIRVQQQQHQQQQQQHQQEQLTTRIVEPAPQPMGLVNKMHLVTSKSVNALAMPASAAAMAPPPPAAMAPSPPATMAPPPPATMAPPPPATKALVATTTPMATEQQAQNPQSGSHRIDLLSAPHPQLQVPVRNKPLPVAALSPVLGPGQSASPHVPHHTYFREQYQQQVLVHGVISSGNHPQQQQQQQHSGAAPPLSNTPRHPNCPNATNHNLTLSPAAMASNKTAPRPKNDMVDTGHTKCDDGNLGELRCLEEEYLKRLQRAKKAFDTRKQNLQRSKEEKEAQHLKQLEKHEKDLAEYEKRLLQADLEEQRRLEQLENDWMQERDELKRRLEEMKNIDQYSESERGDSFRQNSASTLPNGDSRISSTFASTKSDGMGNNDS